MVKQTVFQISKKNASAFIQTLAVVGLTVSISLLCISSATINGFSDSVAQKMYHMLGTAQIQSYSYAFGSSDQASDFTTVIQKLPDHITSAPVLEQNCLVLNGDQLFQANKLLGLEYSRIPKEWNEFLIEGDYPKYLEDNQVPEICLNQIIADQLNASLGDTILLKFPEAEKKRIRQRKVKVSGLMQTGVDEFSNFAIWNIQDARNFLQLGDTAVHSLLLMNASHSDQVMISEQLDFNFIVRSTEEIYPNVFQWLNLQATNEWVIGGIIAMVAFFNCMAMAYVFVVERRVFIALFRLHGASSRWLVNQLFKSLSLLNIKAIVIGNIIALIISLSLQYGKWIPLDESTYYISYVPAKVIAWKWLLFDLVFIAISLLTAYLPYKRFSQIELEILATENRTQMS